MVARTSVDTFSHLQRLLASVARCHNPVCHLLGVLAGEMEDTKIIFMDLMVFLFL